MNKYKMGEGSLLIEPNCLYSGTGEVQDTVIVSYKCSLIVIKTPIQLGTPASIGAGFSERKLHM
jgi:hypothetical protein